MIESVKLLTLLFLASSPFSQSDISGWTKDNTK